MLRARRVVAAMKQLRTTTTRSIPTRPRRALRRIDDARLAAVIGGAASPTSDASRYECITAEDDWETPGA